ncbi:unnamed protein product [Prorocentrum cordatum]|uniref:Uncharacterized protein n=1 Tax=Prorocentrum cordatum TaxID=2364126 RepID=A0ABN9TKH8_9DINO|nr:unnamed protein product [Polarella glacialis]
MDNSSKLRSQLCKTSNPRAKPGVNAWRLRSISSGGRRRVRARGRRRVEKDDAEEEEEEEEEEEDNAHRPHLHITCREQLEAVHASRSGARAFRRPARISSGVPRRRPLVGELSCSSLRPSSSLCI